MKTAFAIFLMILGIFTHKIDRFFFVFSKKILQ